MNKYAKLEGQTLNYAPTNYTLEDGRLIINFNKSIILLKEYGYKEVINVLPPFEDDENCEFLNYTENDNSIFINYKVVKNEVPEKTEVEILKEQIASMQNSIDFLLTKQ